MYQFVIVQKELNIDESKVEIFIDNNPFRHATTKTIRQIRKKMGSVFIRRLVWFGEIDTPNVPFTLLSPRFR